jgi:hypothetical protein
MESLRGETGKTGNPATQKQLFGLGKRLKGGEIMAAELS